jgi:hypothetical protein
MRWLVTTRAGADLESVRAKLSALGASADEAQEPIPLDRDEQVIEVEGPPDLPARLSLDDDVRKISPSSEMTYY